MVPFGLGHGVTQFFRVLKHPDQDLQAEQIRVLRGYDFKYSLEERERNDEDIFKVKQKLASVAT